MPAMMVGLLFLVIVRPDFINISHVGFASEHAAIPLALGASLIVGFLAQRSRLCFAGAWRDVFLIKNTNLISGVITALLAAFAVNVALGQFHPGFFDQPLSNVHTLVLDPSKGFFDNFLAQANVPFANFLATTLVGLGATLLTGCPLRQLILSGEGDTDAVVTVLGLFAGTAIMRNFNLTACAGIFPPLGYLVIGVGLASCLAIGWFMREK